MGGVKIPAGSILILLLASANRDETVFANADTFEPASGPTLKSHVAFGTHIHSCLGAPLARLEGRSRSTRLFERLPELRLSEENDFSFRASFNFRGPKALNLEFDRVA